MKVCYFFWIIFSLCQASFASTEPLSLQDAVRFALENSPEFDTAKKTQSIRELEYKSAVAKLLPSADFTTTNGLQNNIPLNNANSVYRSNPTAPWYSALSFGLTENLYDNGASLTNLNIAKQNRSLAIINYLKSRDSLTLDVISEFYRFSLASIILELRKQQQNILEKQLKTLSSQYQQGFKTKSDFLRLKTQVQRAEINSIAAENNIALSIAELRKLLGVSFQNSTPPSFDPVVVPKNQNIENLLPKKPPSIDNIYDIQITKIQKEVLEKSVTLVERKYWPQVSLNSGITYNNQNYIQSNASFSKDQSLTWNALITLQYNFWDWGTRRREVEIAKFNRDIQGNSLDKNLLNLHSNIISLMADISRISESYKLSQELLILEEESNKNLEVQYREGKVMYLDLITSLNNLLDAKVQYYTSYFEALQASSKYKFYEGKLYEAIIKN